MGSIVHRRANIRLRATPSLAAGRQRSTTLLLCLISGCTASPLFPFPDVTGDAAIDRPNDSRIDQSSEQGADRCEPMAAEASPPGCRASTRGCLENSADPDDCVTRDPDPQGCAESIVLNRWVCATGTGGCATAYGCTIDCLSAACPSGGETCFRQALDGACGPTSEAFYGCVTESVISRGCPAFPPEAFFGFVADAGVDAGRDAGRDVGTDTSRDVAVDVAPEAASDAGMCRSPDLGDRCSLGSNCGGCGAVCQSFGLNDPLCCMPLRSGCQTASDCCAGGGSSRACSAAGRCCQSNNGICSSDSECCSGMCRRASGQASGLCWNG